MNDSGLRLRPWASLMLFLSAYSPLMIIFIIKDCAVNFPWFPRTPFVSGALLFLAIASIVMTIRIVRKIVSDLPVVITKATYKSGDMFSYTIPYMISFMNIDLGDWRTIVSFLLLMTILFIIAYRTQTVFINPILALAGYMLVDCSFKRGTKESQGLVITNTPIRIGNYYKLEQLSYYLYIAAQNGLNKREDHNED